MQDVGLDSGRWEPSLTLKGGLYKRKAHQNSTTYSKKYELCDKRAKASRSPSIYTVLLSCWFSLEGEIIITGENCRPIPQQLEKNSSKWKGRGKVASRSLKYFDYLGGGWGARNKEVASADSFHYLLAVKNHNPNGTLIPISTSDTSLHDCSSLPSTRLLQLAFFSAKGRKAEREVTITQPLKIKLGEGKVSDEQSEREKKKENKKPFDSKVCAPTKNDTCPKEHKGELLAAALRR